MQASHKQRSEKESQQITDLLVDILWTGGPFNERENPYCHLYFKYHLLCWFKYSIKPEKWEGIKVKRSITEVLSYTRLWEGCYWEGQSNKRKRQQDLQLNSEPIILRLSCSQHTNTHTHTHTHTHNMYIIYIAAAMTLHITKETCGLYMCLW